MTEITNLSRLQMKHLTVDFDIKLQTLVYDRKLKDGPGNNNYGLIVCRSLGLPEEFLNYAEKLNFNFKMNNNNFLKDAKSNYNSKMLKDNCEICGEPGIDVDHMISQCKSDKNGNINFNGYIFNKNHPANLQNLCKSCHKRKTKEDVMFVRKKTLKGYKTMECN